MRTSKDLNISYPDKTAVCEPNKEMLHHSPTSSSAAGNLGGHVADRFAIRTIIAFLVCIVIAVGLESFLFNIDHWTHPASPHGTYVVEPDHIESSEAARNTDFTRAEVDREAELPAPGGIPESANSYERIIFDDLDNADVSSLAFELKVSEETSAYDKMTVTVDIADSGQLYQTYKVMEESLPETSTRVLMPIDVYGYMKQLVITVWGSSEHANVSISNVTLGEEIPFSFSWVRCIIIATMLFVLFVLRPNSLIWRFRHLDKPYIAVGFATFMLLIGSMAFLWGTDDPNPDSWGSERAGARDEYAMLARAFLDDGTLYLSQTPPDYLMNMDDISNGADRLCGNENIYDPSARKKMQFDAGSNVAPKLDVAYYNGKYYVYFGVIPALIAYVPFHAITGGDLSNTLALFPALLVFAIFSFLLLDLLVRRKIPNASVGAVACAYAGLLLSTSIVHTLAFPLFYNVPVIFALMFLVVGTYLLVTAYYARYRLSRLLCVFFGVACLVATLGCRPQITIAAVAVGTAYLVFAIRSRQLSFSDIAVAAVPVVLICGGILWYNYARFGSVLDFGSNYNLAINDMTLRGHSIVRAIEGIFWYIFGFPRFSLDFPYVELFFPQTGYYGRSVTEEFTFGMFAQAPFLVMILAFVTSKSLPKQAKVGIATMVGIAFLVAAFDAEGAGILVRYIQDFGYLFGFAFALGLLYYDGKRFDHVASYLDPSNTSNFRHDSANNELNHVSANGYSILYAPIGVLLIFSVLAAISIWISYAMAQPLSDQYPLNFYDVKNLFDTWGTHLSQIS